MAAEARAARRTCRDVGCRLLYSAIASPCRLRGRARDFESGTSGYNYPEWKGKFYRRNLRRPGCCRSYAERFGTVEINASFYRMPTPKVLAGWAAQVPESFVFALKAPKRITHERRLKECEPDVQFFVESAATLGHRLGPLLLPVAAQPEV